MPEWSDIPSGVWSGTAYHWLFHRKGFRSNLCLWRREREFSGYGTSPDGTFTVQGACDRQTGRVQFTMYYHAGHEVTYYGYYDGCVIRGIWHSFQSGTSIVGDFQFLSKTRSASGSPYSAQATPEPPWESDCPHCRARFSLRPRRGRAAACTLCRHEYDPLGSPQGVSYYRSAHSTRAMSDDQEHIPRPCRQCGYDLTGLPIRHRCPECGSRYDWAHECRRAFLEEHPEVAMARNTPMCRQCGYDLSGVPKSERCLDCGLRYGGDSWTLYSGRGRAGLLWSVRPLLVWVAVGLLLVSVWHFSSHRGDLDRQLVMFGAVMMVCLVAVVLATEWVGSVLKARQKLHGRRKASWDSSVTADKAGVLVIERGARKHVTWNEIESAEFVRLTRRLIVRNANGDSLVSIRLPPRYPQDGFRVRRAALDITELARVRRTTGGVLEL